MNNHNLFICSNCKGTDFVTIDNENVCKECGFVLSYGEKQQIMDRVKNKIIHFNNILSTIETINNSEIDDVLEEIRTKVEEGMDPAFVDSVYISETLKKFGKKKKYVLNIQIHNIFSNNTSFWIREKKNITILFTGFVLFISKNYSEALERSMPYYQILNNIIKYLDDNNSNCIPVNGPNESIDIFFDRFINNLCDVYLKNTKSENKVFYVPTIYNYPNKLYTGDFFFNPYMK